MVCCARASRESSGMLSASRISRCPSAYSAALSAVPVEGRILCGIFGQMFTHDGSARAGLRRAVRQSTCGVPLFAVRLRSGCCCHHVRFLSFGVKGRVRKCRWKTSSRGHSEKAVRMHRGRRCRCRRRSELPARFRKSGPRRRRDCRSVRPRSRPARRGAKRTGCPGQTRAVAAARCEA